MDNYFILVEAYFITSASRPSDTSAHTSSSQDPSASNYSYSAKITQAIII